MRALAVIPVVLASCALAGLAARPDASPVRSSPPPQALPFISDDYAAALSQARARKVPLFIESWAPW